MLNFYLAGCVVCFIVFYIETIVDDSISQYNPIVVFLGVLALTVTWPVYVLFRILNK